MRRRLDGVALGLTAGLMSIVGMLSGCPTGTCESDSDCSGGQKCKLADGETEGTCEASSVDLDAGARHATSSGGASGASGAASGNNTGGESSGGNGNASNVASVGNNSNGNGNNSAASAASQNVGNSAIGSAANNSTGGAPEPTTRMLDTVSPSTIANGSFKVKGHLAPNSSEIITNGNVIIRGRLSPASR